MLSFLFQYTSTSTFFDDVTPVARYNATTAFQDAYDEATQTFWGKDFEALNFLFQVLV